MYSAIILQDEGYKVTVLEADNRVGGRVFSQRNIPGNPETGGTAFGSGYARIIDISNRFNIKLNDILYAYYLSDIKKINKLKLIQKDFTIALEVPLKIQSLKQTYFEIPSKERKRISGKKKVREFVDGFKLLRYMMYFYLNYIFF